MEGSCRSFSYTRAWPELVLMVVFTIMEVDGLDNDLMTSMHNRAAWMSMKKSVFPPCVARSHSSNLCREANLWLWNKIHKTICDSALYLVQTSNT